MATHTKLILETVYCTTNSASRSLSERDAFLSAKQSSGSKSKKWTLSGYIGGTNNTSLYHSKRLKKKNGERF